MCYRFELLEFEDCLFQNIDATYILHLEGNGRIDHIHEQLKTYHPSKKVYIVYNKGYKNCAKELHIQSSGYDITHANINAFEHAQQYKHVLVLEDDFIFSKEVVDHTKHVDTFLERDTKFVYQLGSNPIVALPIDMYHYRVLGLLGHANIYSSSCRKQLMHDFDNGKIEDDHRNTYMFIEDIMNTCKKFITLYNLLPEKEYNIFMNQLKSHKDDLHIHGMAKLGVIKNVYIFLMKYIYPHIPKDILYELDL